MTTQAHKDQVLQHLCSLVYMTDFIFTNAGIDQNLIFDTFICAQLISTITDFTEMAIFASYDQVWMYFLVTSDI